MDCNICESQIESYIDSELTLSDKRDFDDHIGDCSHCSSKLKSAHAIQNLTQSASYKNTPPALKLNIQNKLRDYTGEEEKKSNIINWFGIITGSALTGALATWVMLTFVLVSPMQMQVANEVVASHVRSLMVDHVIDIKTDDRHTVKPWFNGKVDFSPTVKDLKDSGFELLGGRLDYLQEKNTSVVIYKRREHIINTFISKSENSSVTTFAGDMSFKGYNLIHWSSNGLDYWVVSDLNMTELKLFSKLSKKSR